MRYTNPGWILLLLSLLTGCNKKSHYEQVVDQQLATGVRHDSLFLGFTFGMSKKEFYADAWKLNKQHLLTNGAGNLTIKYNLDSLKMPAKMNFYPQFYHDKIYLMPVRIAYTAWAPWNRKLWADSLEQDVIHLFSRWYGPGFFKVSGAKGKAAWVKVDGNRRIVIVKHGNMAVDILFTDLTVKNKIKKQRLKKPSLWDKVESLF